MQKTPDLSDKHHTPNVDLMAPTMFAKDEMKRSRIVKTPTSVLFVRDWTIFLVTLCKAAGKC